MIPVPIVVAVLAVVLVPEPWGLVAAVGAVGWEILEKVFWYHRTKSIPIAVGPEAMIGQRASVVTACRPDGTVQLFNERWNARCKHGARVGDTVTVEAIDRLTLIVS